MSGPVKIPRSVATRECPICGETMRIEAREELTRVPGYSHLHRRTVREWICRECDNFEDASDDES